MLEEPARLTITRRSDDDVQLPRKQPASNMRTSCCCLLSLDRPRQQRQEVSPRITYPSRRPFNKQYMFVCICKQGLLLHYTSPKGMNKKRVRYSTTQGTVFIRAIVV